MTMTEQPLVAKDTRNQKTVVELNLTAEQARALSAHAKEIAEGKVVLRMIEDGETLGDVKAGAYSYYGNTCCVVPPQILTR